MADNVIVRVPEQQFIRGEDGYSPEVTIENIDHGHSVTITDRDHPTGQSFPVLDGDSAYEQAVAGGYEGTETQFNEELASFKELSDETKEAAPFYAEYFVTTKEEIEAAINYKRQIFLRPNQYSSYFAQFAGSFWYIESGISGTGYRFITTIGASQTVFELKNSWSFRTYNLNAPAERAEAAAATALTRMNSADASAQAAAGSAGDASTAATTATTKAGEASDSATAADGSAKDSEAYAIGKRNGTDVGSTDPAYHNNSKYYAEQAASSASDAVTAKGAAETAQGLAEDAQEAAEQAQEAAEAVLASIPADYTTLTEDVDDLKSQFTHNIADTGKSVGDFSEILTKTSNAVTNNRDGTYTLGKSDYGTIIFGTVMKLPTGTYMLYGVPTGFSFLSTGTDVQTAFETNYSSDPKEICLTEEKTCYLGYRNTVRPSASFTITPYLIGNRIYFNEKDIDELESKITFEKYGTAEDVSNNYINGNGNEAASANAALTKRYYNYTQDGLLSVEVTEPYYFYAYGWERSTYLGSLHAGGTFSTTGTALLLNKINLADYPDITFKFALRHLVNGSSVEVPLDNAVKFKFTFRNNADLSRRRISVMGDSISSFTGYTTAGSPDAYYPLASARLYYVQNMYWKCLADRNGMVIDTIDAYAGSTVGDKWQDAVRVPFIDDTRINSLGTPDVIIVEGGINDFGGNPLGDYPALGDYSKTYEFRTAYSLLLNKLKSKYTNATIICLSMISPRNYNNTTFPEKQTEVIQSLATDTTPHTFAEFNESIEKIAKQYQCTYCDITDLLNYYLNPTSSLGPHWFFNLHLEVAYRIEQLLKQIYT